MYQLTFYMACVHSFYWSGTRWCSDADRSDVTACCCS